MWKENNKKRAPKGSFVKFLSPALGRGKY